MIQRIQSLFLFIVFVTGVAAFFYPIASFWGELYVVKLGVLEVEEPIAYDTEWPSTLLLTINLALISILAFTTIFMYKRRKLQVKLIRFNLLMNIVYLALIFFYYVPELESLTMTDADYIREPGIYLPIVSVIFLILANRFIMKDEKLVRSADRLR